MTGKMAPPQPAADAAAPSAYRAGDPVPTLLALVRAFVVRHWRPYAGAAVMLVAIAVLTVWIPQRIGAIVDALVAGGLTAAALRWALGELVMMGLAIYLLRVGWRMLLYAASYRLGVQLRLAIYAQLSVQDAQFYQRRRTGELMALATNDVDAVELAAGEALLAAFDGTLTLVLVVAAMAIGVDWRLALIALLPFPLMAWGFSSISARVHRASRNALDRFSDLNDHVQQTVAGVRTVRALGLAGQMQAQLRSHAGAAERSSVQEQRWEAAYDPAVGISLTLATALTLGAGGWLVWQRELTVGGLTAFTIYLGQLIWPMFAAGWVLALFERGRAAWDRLGPVLHAPPGVADCGTVTSMPGGALQLAQISFTYPGQQSAALRDIHIILPPGQTLGIVGPTGAGKSTLLAVIQRQLLPQAGQLRWGDIAVADFTLEALRSAMAWVPQEAFLFSASVAENIALARPQATGAQIEHVAQRAALHDDIVQLPGGLGYDTVVGERGVTLSGGQRQRVALARALLVDAPLLLLDDALSAVDTGTEAQILAHLRTARRGRTAIIVTHRLSAVAQADQIVVLHEGRIVESGDHPQLLAQGGWYASQWRYQQLAASLADA